MVLWLKGTPVQVSVLHKDCSYTGPGIFDMLPLLLGLLCLG